MDTSGLLLIRPVAYAGMTELNLPISPIMIVCLGNRITWERIDLFRRDARHCTYRERRSDHRNRRD